MFDGRRLRDLMATRDVSQSALARQVGVSQTTVAKLVSSKGYGSKYLHKIARALGTSAEYLSGETDDPDENAPPPLPPPQVVHINLPVALPSENALTAMFEGLLRAIGAADRGLTLDEQARELAQLLPTGLSQISGDLIELPRPPRSRSVPRGRPAPAEAAPSAEPEFQR